MAAASPPPKWFQARPFLASSLAGLIGMLAIGGASLFASQQAGEAEATADVRALTHLVAKTVVEPNLSPALLAGDPESIAALHAIVTERVLDDTTLRVKLWTAGGEIVYSDEQQLIGEVYELGEDENRSLWSGEIVSEVSGLAGQENRFEAELADRMLEVYLPIDGPDGAPLLYESYFAMSVVGESESRIRGEFVPIIIAALGLMEALHLALAWGTRQRLHRNQADREQLLQQAIQASDLERRRIARDLHDGVVQDLVGTSFAITAAAESAVDSSPEFAADLRSAAVGARRSLQSLRSLLVDIYPPNLHEHGLEAALVDLLAPASNLGIETELTLTGETDLSPATVALVYRVIQESVRNVFRHADATSLTITVDAKPDETVAVVSDNGSGFSTDKAISNGHFGLRLLTDLTNEAGAGFVIDSNPGTGTTVRLEVAV